MSNEFNKIIMGVLIAGITAMLAGFIAKNAVHPESLINEAVAIDGAADEGDHGAETKADEGPEPILALLAGADIEKGAKVSKACAACHSFDKGGAAKTGPNLWGILGRDVASAEGFKYSKGLEAIEGSWDYDKLNAFLTKPKKFVKDTKMNYAGLKKPEQRAQIIAWLRTLSDSPVPLPSAEEAAAEGGGDQAAPANAEEAAPESAEGEGEAEAGDAADTAPEAGTESPDSPAVQSEPENSAPAANAGQTPEAEETPAE